MRNIILISDTHIGCQFGLYDTNCRIKLDGGGYYSPSKNQKKVWGMWNIFWNEWVPTVTKGEPYIIIHNGDVIDGHHHGSKTQITQNITDQEKLAKSILLPQIKNAHAYYHVRGTEAHVGKSAEYEEDIAYQLGAIPNESGNYARYELWIRLGKPLLHFSHHIGTTGSSAYESTAVYKELVEAYNEAGRWNEKPPDLVARSHRHRQFEIRVANNIGYGISLVTPGWQLKTPFVHRLPTGRSSTPQIGGYLIRRGDEDELYTRYKVWKIGREKEVKYERA